jgi:cell division protein FtsL
MSRSRRRAGARSPRLRVVTPPRPRGIPFLIVCFLVIGVLVLGVVTVQALASQGAFRMQELSRHNADLVDANGRLELQIAELSAPQRIEREARRFGYIQPDPDHVHTIVVGGRP